MRTADSENAQQFSKSPDFPLDDRLSRNQAGTITAKLKGEAKLHDLGRECTSKRPAVTFNPISWKGENNGNRNKN
jgi:hypothetical protein